MGDSVNDTVRSRASALRLYEHEGSNRMSLSLYLSHTGLQAPSAAAGGHLAAANQLTVRSNRSARSSALHSDYSSAADYDDAHPHAYHGGGDKGDDLSPMSDHSDHEKGGDDDDDEDDGDARSPRATLAGAARGRAGQTERQAAAAKTADATKARLGTIQGVFLPCVQNILGIILFVRLGWIVGVGGIGQTVLICVLAVLCTLLTTLSLSAISTNGQIAAGGAYYMISRSLGPKWGGSVGVLFYLSNVCATVLYVLGAIEILTLNLIPGMSLGSNSTNARVYGTVTLFLLGLIVLVGISLVTRTSVLFLVAVLLAIVSSLIGIFASNRPGMPEGVTGFPGNFGTNWPPQYGEPDLYGVPQDQTFFGLFGIFFPSVTGIMAGTNRSGDLRSPNRSIPKGTLSALLVTSLIYLMFIMLLGTIMIGPLLRTKDPPSGLLVASVAWPSPYVVIIGCLFASLGAGLQCFVGAPRLLQAIAKDGLVPFLHWFAPLSRPVSAKLGSRTFQLHSGGEPRRALFVTLVIAEAICLIGSLDMVAPVVTMLYLICYLFVNLSCALLGFLHEPNWRPSWRWYHWSVSFAGAVLCVVYMFLLSWYVALVALFVTGCLYVYIEYRGARVHWGDGIRSFHVHMAQQNLINLEKQEVSAALDAPGGAADAAAASTAAKNWRPQLLVLLMYDSATRRLLYPNVLGFVSQLRKVGGLAMVYGCVQGDYCDPAMAKVIDEARYAVRVANRAFRTNAFSEVLAAPDMLSGVAAGIQSAGLGVLRPNTVVLPIPSNSARMTERDADLFVGIVRTAISSDKALLALKNPHLFPAQKAVRRGTIDIFWILNDGGILTLVPYLLRKHRVWRRCPLRIFAIAQLDDNSVAMKRALIATLNALRIDHMTADVLELGAGDVSEFAYEKTVRMLERQELLHRVGLHRGPSMLHAPASGLKFAAPADPAAAAEPAEAETAVDATTAPVQHPETAGFNRDGTLGGAAVAAGALAAPLPDSGDGAAGATPARPAHRRHASRPSISGAQEWLRRMRSRSISGPTELGGAPGLEHRRGYAQSSSSAEDLASGAAGGLGGTASTGSETSLLSHAQLAATDSPRSSLSRNTSVGAGSSSDEAIPLQVLSRGAAGGKAGALDNEVPAPLQDAPSNLANIFVPRDRASLSSRASMRVTSAPAAPEKGPADTPGDFHVTFVEPAAGAGGSARRPSQTPEPGPARHQRLPSLSTAAAQQLQADMKDLMVRAREKDRVQMMETAIKLNELFTKHSRDAALVLTNLPAPSPNQSNLDWLEYVNVLTNNLPRVVLVNGTGSEVVTAFF